MISCTQREELECRAACIRRDIVSMLKPPKVGHLGGANSCTDILAVLYFAVMRHDPKNPKWAERDRFIMSKGHSAMAQYAALAESGYFPIEDLAKSKDIGCYLQGHPDIRKTPGIEANTGSLGQGLSVGLGLALAGKLDEAAHRIYVLLGDGELAEGQVWEAAMAAAAYQTDNLVAIIDHNRLQATGAICDRMNMGEIRAKWEAFGWQVLEVDGHDVMALLETFEQAKGLTGKPVAILAHTIKGKGVDFAENNAAYHNAAMKADEYAKACACVCVKLAEEKHS